MGYYTNYQLEFSDKKLKPLEDIDHQLIYDYINNHQEMEWAFGKNCSGGDDSKWYDHEDDMKELSKAFSNVLFTLHGRGEEQGDEWYKYFLNGKMQECRAIVTFEEYNPRKLK